MVNSNNSNERRVASGEGRMGKSSWLMAETEVGNGPQPFRSIVAVGRGFKPFRSTEAVGRGPRTRRFSFRTVRG